VGRLGDDGFGNGGWIGDGWSGGGLGYHAGVVDAQSDHQSNANYNPYPSTCCHSWLYKQAFAEGYQHEWNVLQNQEQEQTQVTKQSADVNVENSPGTTVIIHNNVDQGQGQGQGSGGYGGWGP
jgi:hypothetical protein